MKEFNLIEELAAQWHPTKNGNLTPEMVSPGSSKKVWWLGKDCQHEWNDTISNRVKTKTGTGCSICLNKRVLAGFNDLGTVNPEVAAQWHPTKNGELTPAMIVAGSGKKVWWQCTLGHEWDMQIASRTRQHQNCPYCSGKRILVGFNDLATTHSLLVEEWHPTKNGELTPRETTFGSTTRVWWLGKDCQHEWDAPVYVRTHQKQKCPMCSGKRVLVGFNDLATQNPQLASEWHPSKNGELTPKMVGAGRNQKVWWLSQNCHHEWYASIKDRHDKNAGCPFCAGQKVLIGFNDLVTTHPVLSQHWHPTKNKDLVPTMVLAGTKKRVHWICALGHEWESPVKFEKHKRNNIYCATCLGRRILPGFNDLLTRYPALTVEWHPTKNGDLDPTTLNASTHRRVWWQCSRGHEWEIAVRNRTSRQATGCPDCDASSYVSKSEQELADFVAGLGLTVIQSDRKTLVKMELDIFVPSKMIAIEFNGLYWHSESGGKGRNYHYNKFLAAKNAGIQLIQIWEDEYLKNPVQVKRMIAHKLGASREPKVFARKTKIVSLKKNVVEEFLNEHHVQGYSSGTYYVGLVDKASDDLVAVLVLRNEAGTDGKTLNIVRYATSCSVVGGFTKLLKFAEVEYTPESFITFADHCVSDGGLYAQNGFIADKNLAPDYRYVVRLERKHKFGYRLQKFRNDPGLKYDPVLSERELALLNRIPRIWDAGKTRWRKTLAPPTVPSSS